MNRLVPFSCFVGSVWEQEALVEACSRNLAVGIFLGPNLRTSGKLSSELGGQASISYSPSIKSKILNPELHDMGDYQNYGPLLGPPNTSCRIVSRRTPKKFHDFDNHPHALSETLTSPSPSLELREPLQAPPIRLCDSKGKLRFGTALPPFDSVLGRSLPRPPNVRLLRALWSLFIGIWGFLKGTLGLLVWVLHQMCKPNKHNKRNTELHWKVQVHRARALLNSCVHVLNLKGA